MFGLGWFELLIIAGAISLIAGPAMLRKVVGAARDVQRAKADLTGPGALDRLLGGDEDERDGDGAAGDDDEPRLPREK